MSVGRLYLLFAVSLAAVSLSCSKDEKYYLDELKGMETKEYRGEELSSERIEELRAGIRRYRKVVEKKVDAGAQIGIFHKMIAVQYMRAAMYRQAYDSLKEALTIHPENPILFYLSGLCAARYAQTQADNSERDFWLDQAEFHYNRAITLDPLYVGALYGLSVLYIYERGRIREAESLLERILAKESKNVDAMFLLANVYYQMRRFEATLQIYDDIIRLTRVDAKKKEALENKRRVESELYD